MTTKPQPGQIYRHRKHDPPLFWHEYEVICIVSPGPGLQDSPAYFTVVHTDSGRWHDILPAAGSSTAKSGDDRHWAFPKVTEPHIAYKNTQPDHCDPDWVFCLRPLTEFVDGRFTLVS